MILLSIITINRNNAGGLERTMRSVSSQSRQDFEYVVIDGASSDNSVDVIQQFSPVFGDRMKWVTEQDSGIYNAMNKGIRMARGEYVQILNSGDCLAAEDVTGRMLDELEGKGKPPILYGNMIKVMPDGQTLIDKCFAGKGITLFGMYTGSLNHDPAYIRRDLFEQYGFYDETLRIVSDWKWYLQTIVLGEVHPVYTDINVTLFEMNGISETAVELHRKEKRRVLEELIPAPILSDYDRYATSMLQFDRLKRHPWACKLTWMIERVLFKLEKWRINRKRIVSR